MKWLIIVICLSMVGCAGTGFNKQMTLMPDQLKLEVDSNPQDNWNSKEVTGALTWNLK